jgi:hypothetical protein
LRTRLPKRNGLLAVIPPFLLDARSEQDIDFRAKEGGRLLFLKNGNDPDKLVVSWREALPEPTFLALADMASELANRISTEGNPRYRPVRHGAFSLRRGSICRTSRACGSSS